MEECKMSITKFNSGGAYFEYDKDKNRGYVSLRDLYESNDKNTEYKLLGLYINESKFGEQPSAVLEDVQANLPKHLVSTVKEIRGNQDLVDDINNGKVGFKIYEYEDKKFGKKCYSINWIEFQPSDEDIPF